MSEFDENIKKVQAAAYVKPFLPDLNIPNPGGDRDMIVKHRQLAALEYIAAQLAHYRKAFAERERHFLTINISANPELRSFVRE
jgi:hypothetical protein